MIAFPGSWVRQFGVNLTTAYPPDAAVRFRYHEHIGTCPSFSMLVRDALARIPELRVHRIGEMSRTVTREGEYGAVVAVEGVCSGQTALLVLAATFIDDHATLLEALAMREDQFGQVEQLALELARTQTFGLSRRPRRFFYVPPIDWQAIPSGMVANWYPQDFPANLSTIIVPPALPLDDDPARVIELAIMQLDDGLHVEQATRDTIVSASGAPGVIARVVGHRDTAQGHGPPLYREGAYFCVDGWGYRMQLETGTPAQVTQLREVFSATARSFRPLPTAEEMRLGAAFASRTAIFDHWAS